MAVFKYYYLSGKSEILHQIESSRPHVRARGREADRAKKSPLQERAESILGGE
jgi:hypothetical protein